MKGQRLLAFAIALLVSITGGLLVHEERVGRFIGAEGLELYTLDLRQRLATESRKAGVEGARESEIVLVLFDEESVGNWDYLSPFPRPVIAELIDALAGAGARTIGLDVYLDLLFPGLGGDDLLRDAIERAGNVVLVAPMTTEAGRPQLAYPHPQFASVAADVGAAEIPTAFETVRYSTLAVRSDGGLEASWSLALFAHARGLDADALLAQGFGSGRIDVPGLASSWGEVPEEWYEDESGAGFAINFPIRFSGPPTRPGAEDAAGTFTGFSASDVPMIAPFVPEFFRDKIVLVGTGFHDSDKFRSPFYDVEEVGADGEAGEDQIVGWTYGVEVHANALQNLLDGEYLRPLGFGWLLGFLLMLTGIVSLLTFWKGAGWGAAGTVLAALSVMALAGWTFLGEVFLPFAGTVMELDARFLWLPIVSPVSAILMAYVSSTAYVSIVEGRDKRFIKGAFGKYLSPAVVNQIAENPESLKLGGQKRPLTVLFSDLAGFTNISERLDAEDLVALLNDYLTEMTDIVMEEEGYLDKYIGDAIMAFWNAPQEQEDHADRALRCAVRMQRKMLELNDRWAEASGGEEFLVRIGVNTGPAVVGNVGGRDRFDYSAIGDPVNLAARLEPANKSYDTLTMASEFTLSDSVAADYMVRELDLLAVKGKTEPVRVYEILEMHDGTISEMKKEVLSLYNQGLAAYQRMDWELATQYFKTALEVDPSDGPSKVYLERAEECCTNPPPADWDFVVRRKVK